MNRLPVISAVCDYTRQLPDVRHNNGGEEFRFTGPCSVIHIGRIDKFRSLSLVAFAVRDRLR
jgi:hypothetical protein